MVKKYKCMPVTRSAINYSTDKRFQSPTTSAINYSTDKRFQSPTTSAINYSTDKRFQSPTTSAINYSTDKRFQSPTTSAINYSTDKRFQSPLPTNTATATVSVRKSYVNTTSATKTENAAKVVETNSSPKESAASNTAKKLITVKDKNKLKNNVVNINSYMIKIDKNLKELSTNLNTMMVGDKQTPYWNGDDAVKFYNVAIADLKKDIDDYVSARNELDKLGELYELVNSGYKK